MTFNIKATETTTAIITAPDFHGYLGSASLDACVSTVGIRRHGIRGLRLAASEFIRLLHQTAKLRFLPANRPNHDHPVTEAQLGVGNSAIVVLHN